MLKIIKEIHTNKDGEQEMLFEFSRGYVFRVSHLKATRESLLEVANKIHEDTIDLKNK